MANTYSEMGRFLQKSFDIDKTPVKKNLNEDLAKGLSRRMTNEETACVNDMRVALFGVIDALNEYEMRYGKPLDNELIKWTFNSVLSKVLNESLKEAYETDVDLPYDPDASYSVDIDIQSDPDAPYNANTDLPYDPDTPYNVNESLNEEFEISVRSRFTPQKLKVLVNKAINNSGFPIEDIDKIEWLPGKLFETKDVIYILLKDNTEIPIVLPENNIENSIITALHRVLKYDKRYAK